MDIAIVGLGCKFPRSRDPLAYWDLIRSGEVTFRPIPADRWNHATFHDPSLRIPDKAYVSKGAYLEEQEVREFGALHYGLAPRRIQVTDPQHRLLLDAVRCALQDGGFEKRSFDRSRTGVFVGASVSEHKEVLLARVRAMSLFDGSYGRKPAGEQAAALQEALIQNVIPMRAFSIAGNLLNMAAAAVAQQYDLGGPAFAIDAACSSALVATHQAIVNLRAGQIDVAIAGGVYLNLLPDNLIGFSRIGAISRQGECRPFDARADGFIMGEGVGVTVLKRREDAERDGDRIYALIRGSACNNDGRSEGPMTPREGGQLAALRLAYQDAGFAPQTLGLIETHGTATTVGDVVEVSALRSLFTETGWTPRDGARTALGSVKANIGHTMSAAGAAGLVKATLALHHRLLPPQPSVDEENPKLGLAPFGGEGGPFFLPREARPWDATPGVPRRAAVSSFGFGGTNAHLVLEEAPPVRARPARRAARPIGKARNEVFLVSASRPAVLARAARGLADALALLEREGATLADVAFTLAGRASGEARLAVTADSFAQLAERLRAGADAAEAREAGLRHGQEPTPCPPTALGPGLLFSQGAHAAGPQKLALLFPGQGAQKLDLLRELDEAVPAFRTHFDRLDAALGEELHAALGGTLRSFLYPPASKGQADRAEAARALTATQVCQPVLAAANLALHAVLRELGVVGDVYLGHSLGEFVAAAAAGLLPDEECVRFVARRGLAMVALPLSDAGAMASVTAERGVLTELVAALGPQHAEGGPDPVVVANHNHPQQSVLSGSTAGVAAALAALEARGIAATRLDVSHAFHSPLMAGIAPAMESLVGALPLAPGEVPVVSAITGQRYPHDAAGIRRIWVEHGTAPVDFVAALRRAASPAPAGAAAQLFLQVGAGSALLGFVKGSLPEANRAGQATLASRDEDGLAAFAGALGLLWTGGRELDLSPLFEGREARLVLLPPTPLETQNYWPVEKPAGLLPPFELAGPAASGSVVSPAQEAEMDPLVALFREQVALLQSQAKVLEQQAQALSSRAGGGGAGVALPSLPSIASLAAPGAAQLEAAAARLGVPATAQGKAASSSGASAGNPGAAAPAPTGAATAAGGAAQPVAPLAAEISTAILGFVSRISAFPVEAVKTSQTLAGDLGFDSLMTVELDADIAKTFPAAGGIPRSLLGPATTVQNLVDHVVSALNAPTSPAAAGAAPSLSAALGAFAEAGPDLLRFSPRAVQVPLAGLPSEDPVPQTLLVTSDGRGVAKALVARLAAAGHAVVLARFDAKGGAQPAPDLGQRCWILGAQDLGGDELLAAANRAASAPIAGIIHLAGLEGGPSLNDLVLPGAEAPAALLQLHALVQAQGRADSAGGFLAVVTGQGGRLGLESGGSLLGAALAGYTKALGRERPSELVKVLDVDPTEDAAAVAEALWAELRSGNAVPEVGLRAGVRCEAELQPDQASAPLALRDTDVVWVSGGGRGVGAKLARGLARARCGFVLLGRSAPDAQVEETLAALREAGARAAYVRWDVTTPPHAAQAALDATRRELGAPTVILHAAGVAEDGPVAGKDVASLRRVLAPKLAGLGQLLAATAADPLRAAVFVSSWAGRFGNAGQVDYAAANSALSRAATLLPGVRKGVQALSLEYPPWSGTAMVEKIPGFARAALADQGVPFIDDAAGTRALLSALQSGARGEILLALARPARRTAFRSQLTIDRADHVYLEDHQLAGQPVLPLAAALDLAATSALQAVGGAPGTVLLRDFKLRQPVRIPETSRITAQVSGAARDQGELAVSLAAVQPGAALSFSRAPSYVGFAAPGADVAPALASALPWPTLPAGARPELPLSLEEFYGSFTFHGPRLQGIESIEQLSPSGIVGWVRTSHPSDWMRNPDRAEWTIDPLALDSAFQLAGYWAWTQLERAGFPIGIEEYAQLAPLTGGPLRASLTLEPSTGDLVRGTIVLQAADGRVLAVARGVEGEFKHRDPRFLRARGMGSSTSGAGSAGSLSVRSDAAAQGAARVAAQPEAHKAVTPPAPTAPAAAVDEATYKVELFPEVQELEQRLGLAAAFGLKNPYFNVHERVTNDTSVIGGRTMINWSSYNYLGLSGDPQVSRSAQQAIERYGTSVSASRVASGEKPLHRELEAELARYLGTEDSVVMVSGHGVFVTVIGHLIGPGDLILHDALAHDCIMGGAKLSGAKRRPFPHNDWEALDRQLAQLRPHFKRVLIAIEGVYSMDGDISDLPRFIEIKKKYGAMLLVDEAHSLGVLGPTGRGIGEHFDVNRADVDLWMGTLSKSMASCGGYVGGSSTLVQYLRYTAPGFVYSVGITPANAAAALEALRQAQAHPEKVRKLHERARLFLELARERGIDTGMSDGSAVIPAIIGNSLHALQVSEAMRQRGINVQPILYPAVEETAARLRFFCTATHTEQQIRETVEVLAEEIERARAEGGEQQTGSI